MVDILEAVLGGVVGFSAAAIGVVIVESIIQNLTISGAAGTLVGLFTLVLAAIALIGGLIGLAIVSRRTKR